MSPAEIRKQRQNFIRNLKKGNNVDRATDLSNQLDLILAKWGPVERCSEEIGD